MAFFMLGNTYRDREPDRIEEIRTEIPEDFIVSRSIGGEALSRFKDDAWDFTPYGAPSIFYFAAWQAREFDQLSRVITDEIKTIFWLSMFNPRIAINKNKKASSYSAFNLALRAIATIAYHCKTPLILAHLNLKFQAALQSSFLLSSEDTKKVTLHHSKQIKEIVRVCHTAAHDNFCDRLPHWKIIPEDRYDDWFKRLNAASKFIHINQKKTPLIPARIMALLLEESEKELDDALPYMEKLVDFFEAIFENPNLFCDNKNHAANATTRIKRSGRPKPSYSASQFVSKEETLKHFGIGSYLQQKDISWTMPAIGSHLARLQSLSAVIIHLYSGMRHSEVAALPYECSQVIHIPDFGNVNILLSHTKKLASTNYSTMLPWVTSPVTKKAVRVAQCVARINWIRNSPESFPSNKSRVPLWLAASWASCRSPVNYEYPQSYHSLELGDAVKSFKGIEIRQADLDELITFDAFRNWDEDPKFGVGQLWPFTSHQARRAVAVYASRSGMVSLPSLATQFKHLSLMMTALYAENSTFAESFIVAEDAANAHFGMEFRASKKIDDSISFEEQIIEAHSPLLGGQGKVFQAEKERNLPHFLDGARALQQDIKVGKRNFVPLPSGGGCMNETGPCDSYGLDWTFPCYGCSKSIFEKDVLQEAAASMELSMQEMSPKSLAYKFSSERLSLIKARINNEGQ